VTPGMSPAVSKIRRGLRGFSLAEVLAAILVLGILLVGIAHLSARVHQATRRGFQLLREWQAAWADLPVSDICQGRPFDSAQWRYRPDPTPAVWPRTEALGPWTCR
jgi:prepilin-type N-terminal cleavage/methylation domain-containing protein